MSANSKPGQKMDDLSSLVQMDDPTAVWAEAHTTLGLFADESEITRLKKVYDHTVDLYSGNVLGYRECTSGYHDLRHTTDVFLATARLLHGMSLAGSSVPTAMVEPTLVAALMHDIGYIQESGDTGSGAKYTLAHIKRGKEYLGKYLPKAGFDEAEIELISKLIGCTSLSIDFNNAGLADSGSLLAARSLFNADIIGQMADRIYLEKLLFLYREFMEANIKEYSSEDELLERTLSFYRSAWQKILDEGEYHTRHMRAHFRERWQDDRDLYTRAVDNNMAFLKKILSDGKDGKYRDFLKREGMVEKLKQLEQKN